MSDAIGILSEDMQSILWIYTEKKTNSSPWIHVVLPRLRNKYKYVLYTVLASWTCHLGSHTVSCAEMSPSCFHVFCHCPEILMTFSSRCFNLQIESPNYVNYLQVSSVLLILLQWEKCSGRPLSIWFEMICSIL